MQSDRLFFRQAFGEIVALKNLFDGYMRRQPHKAIRAEFVHPLRVEANFSLLRIEQLEDLTLVSFSVRVYLFARQLRSGGRLSGRIADQTREVSDQENHRMAQLLKRAQFANDDSMTQMNVW